MQSEWGLLRRASGAGLACAAALAAADPALAQSTSPDQTPAPQAEPQRKVPGPAKTKPDAPAKDKKDAKGSTTVQGVTVTAQQAPIRTDIDRRSYDLTKDLQTQAGASLADALRNVPQVDVDIQGNVSIRGSGVQILVDGKPSGLFKGGSVAQVLQSLPADQYERVEVMTNPSAAFSPDGSGGIINLITKKTHKAGASGSLRAGVGLDGRRYAGLTGAWQGDKLTISAGAHVQENPQRNTTVWRRETFDTSGNLLTTTDDSGGSRGDYGSVGGHLSADYDVTSATRLSAEAHGFANGGASTASGRLLGSDGSGPIDDIIDLASHFDNQQWTGGGSLSLRHNFSGDEHDLVVSLSRDRTDADRSSISSDTSLAPIVPELFNQHHFGSTAVLTDLKADYEGPMPAQAKLKAGYDLQVEQNLYDSDGFTSAPSPSSPLDPSQSDVFRAERRIEAAYLTYQQPIGKLTVLAGLRVEDTHIDLNQESQNVQFRSDDVQLYPTLHLNWAFDDSHSLLVSYSRRVQRPDLQELDPFRIIYSPFDSGQGNPDLKPEQTQQIEAGYQYKKGPTVFIVTAFAKLNAAGVTPVTTSLGDNDFLETEENLTRSREIGLEFVASGKIGKAWTYNLSASGYQQTIDASDIGLVAARSGFAADGHAQVTWQATPKDMFQLSANAQPEQVNAQGRRDGNAMMFLSYRRKVDDRLYLLVQAIDVTRGAHFGDVLDTPTLKGFDDYRPSFQTLMFGFTYAFGAGAKRDPGFDFGAN